jgi:hypothetical protein
VAYQPGSASPYRPQSPAPPAARVEPTIYEPPPYPTSSSRPVPPPPRRNGGKVALTFVLVLLILGGAGVSGYLWWDRSQRRDNSTGAGGPAARAGGTGDPHLAVLQAFAGDRPLADCTPGTPNERQLARRGCVADGVSITYALYKKHSLRNAERQKVQSNHDHNSPKECLSQTGISPDNRRGRYIEYTYKASDDNRWYAAVWWDDGESTADGAAVMTMRTPWDQKSSDPAEPLRRVWLSWGYRLAD